MAGYRSLLAFWVGGASSITPTTTGGIKSLLAPWTGGAATAPGGGSYARWPQQPRYNDDEEVLMLVATAFMHILDMEGES